MTLLEALIVLRDKVNSGSELKRSGICYNLYNIAGDYIYEFSRVSTRWKHFSGDPGYPVSGWCVFSSNLLQGTLWVGEQRDLRIDLINFVIKELQNQISESASSN